MVIFLLGSRVAMPEQDVGAFCVPVPVHLSPKVVDAGAERLLLRIALAKILACAQKPLNEIGCFDEVAARIVGPEGDFFPGRAVEIVGKDAIILLGGLEIIEHVEQTPDSFCARNPSSLDGHNHGHDAEAGSADRQEVGASAPVRAGAIAGHAALGVRKVPEIPEGLPLNQFQERIVRNAFRLSERPMSRHFIHRRQFIIAQSAHSLPHQKAKSNDITAVTTSPVCDPFRSWAGPPLTK